MSTDTAEIGAIVGRYTINSVRSRPTPLYGATDSTGRPFDLQFLPENLSTDAEFQERLLKAGRAVSGFSHESASALRDWDLTSGRLFVATDPVRGTCLAELIERFGRLDPDTVHQVLTAVTRALESAHQLGISHGDVHPGHIWVAADGSVTLAGFGLAGTIRDHESGINRENPHLDRAADLAAVGALSFEMLKLKTSEEQPEPKVDEAGDEQLAMPGLEDAKHIAADEDDLPWGLTTEMAPVVTHTRDIDAAVAIFAPAQDPQDTQPITVGLVTRFKAWASQLDRRRLLAAVPALGLVVLLVIAALAVGGRADVPELTGLSPTAATAKLERAGLKSGDRESVFSDAEKGTVVGSRPKQGTKLARGKLVTLVVSKGPELLALPVATGLSLDAARNAITSAGFVLGTVTEQFDPQVPTGLVIEQRPSTGSAKRGFPMDLVVSKGPDIVAVPSIVGKPVAEARAALQSAGFQVESVEVFDNNVAKGLVISHRPGGQASRGATITLSVSKGPDLVSIPALRGKSRADAQKALIAAGLVATIVSAPSETVAEGLAVGTEPGSGTSVQRNSKVKLVISTGVPIFAMPNLVGMSRADAKAKATSLGLVVAAEHAVPGSDAPPDRVQGQTPKASTQVRKGTKIEIYYAA